MSGSPPPASIPAERSVLGQIMADGAKVAGEVIGSLLDIKHFYDPTNRMIFECLVDRYFLDDPLDPISIAEALGSRLTRAWNCSEQQAVAGLQTMATGQSGAGNVVDHAKLIKQEFDRRELLEVAGRIERLVGEGTMTPEEIGAKVSMDSMRIATDSLLTQEIVSFADVGRTFINQARQDMQLRQQGVELGAYFGLRFIDDFVTGLRPGELLFTAGEPGTGKTALWWTAALRHAERQAKVPPNLRRNTLVISLEMSQAASGMRIASELTSVDTRAFREGRMTEQDLQPIIREWGRRKNIPLQFNYASGIKASQLRALCVEAIRRHNVTMVIIDHFRYFDMDRHYDSQNREDEDKVRFLKESLAKDLNLAVICLAHTVKYIDTEDGRPSMRHLRGSGQIAADADFISFLYRPWKYATEAEREHGEVRETSAELIWDKDRHGEPGVGHYYFQPQTMTIRDLYQGGI